MSFLPQSFPLDIGAVVAWIQSICNDPVSMNALPTLFDFLINVEEEHRATDIIHALEGHRLVGVLGVCLIEALAQNGKKETARELAAWVTEHIHHLYEEMHPCEALIALADITKEARDIQEAERRMLLLPLEVQIMGWPRLRHLLHHAKKDMQPNSHGSN